ncbi:MAG: FAD-binding protein [Steroidobacteraceae bacterium]|jgi:salicylate hydroxylase
MNKVRVLIAGGGIGGLTAAIALIRRGFEVSCMSKRRSFASSGQAYPSLKTVHGY